MVEEKISDGEGSVEATKTLSISEIRNLPGQVRVFLSDGSELVGLSCVETETLYTGYTKFEIEGYVRE